MRTKRNNVTLPRRRMLASLSSGTEAQSLQSESLYDTLNNSLTDTVWVNPYFMYAQSFTTDSSNCKLESITLGMMGDVARNRDGFFVSLYDATGLAGSPGSLISSPLIGPCNPAFGSNEYFCEQPLNANTTYWVVARVANGGGTYGWKTSFEEPVGSDIGYSENFTFEPKWSKPDSSVRLNMRVTVTYAPIVTVLGLTQEIGIPMPVLVAREA